MQMTIQIKCGITVCSQSQKDIFNEWWCQTSPRKIFSERAADEFRKDLSRPSLASSLVENIFRTLQTHSNATFDLNGQTGTAP